jgi:uncharacterized membrane protein YfcA
MAPLAIASGSLVLALLLGLVAGVLAGLFGLGGGLLFVPTLVLLGLGQLEAQATSLLAILPTVLVGAWSQRRYGNLRMRTAIVLGVASVAGVEVGARIATSLAEDTLQRLFGVLLLAVATQVAWRTRRTGPRYSEAP